MPTNLYRLAIEALGSRSANNIVVNKFNHVAAHSEDKELRRLCESVVRELKFTSSLAQNTPVKEMKAVKTASVLLAYCQERAYLMEK